MKLTLRKVDRPEYSDVKEYEYKGIEFFVANYLNHAVIEPLYEEIRIALPETECGLWSDSAHTWARGKTLQEQRDQLVIWAKEYIDEVISRKEYWAFLELAIEDLERKKKDHVERYLLFNKFSKEKEMKNEVC